MKLRELIRYIEHNQKVILNHGVFSEEFKGIAREINLKAFGDGEIDYIYVDNDIYTKEYLKIRLKRLQQEGRSYGKKEKKSNSKTML